MPIVVKEAYTDRIDGGHVYQKGHDYPRDGYEPTDERNDELLTDKNAFEKPILLHYDKSSKKDILLEVAALKGIAVDPKTKNADIYALITK